ncbi:MAG: hypothetical protein AAGK37_04075 [Pseudomonadota bacterium]
MTLIERLFHWLRLLTLGRALNRARVRNQEAAQQLDAAVREVLRK